LVKRGGSSPDADGSVDWGAVEGGAVVEAGVLADGASFVGFRVSRGGSSLVSIPTGTVSALSAAFFVSDPAGSHFPVPIHGLCTLTALLCSALLTVNRPNELPARSASYTVPDSNAIGIGSALYAVASQNLPPIRIATGTSDALPFAANWSTPTARGPASFFLGTFRSPGVICGRSSCAATTTAHDATHASSATRNAPRYKILRCKILKKAGGTDAVSAAFRTLDFDFSGDTPMNINDKAPDFTLQDENGKEIGLKDLRGKTVVLYFYPRADTPGCTIEACEFRDTYKKMQKTGAVLLGISPDTPKAQKKFQDKFSLPFTLLADADKKVAEAFGVMKEKNMYGKKVWGVARTTFIIGPDGKIQHIFVKVKPEGHSEEVLAYLKESTKGAA
jgi:peroxiredoxin Q/BCP